MNDRYLRIVLTVIAVELAWLGLKDAIPARVDAQAQAATRVVITGVDLQTRSQYLPVAIAGGVRGPSSPSWATSEPLRLESIERAVRVELPGTVSARIVGPIQVDTSQPLSVKSVQAEGTARPGL